MVLHDWKMFCTVNLNSDLKCQVGITAENKKLNTKFKKNTKEI